MLGTLETTNDVKVLPEVETISAQEARELERSVTLTFGDLIREGSQSTTQAFGWGNGETACAVSAAYLAAKSRGLL
jgi:hypothetical protein